MSMQRYLSITIHTSFIVCNLSFLQLCICLFEALFQAAMSTHATTNDELTA